MSAEAYPLQWPKGVPRRGWTQRGNASFNSGGKALSIAEALNRLQLEADRLGARQAVISSNLERRLDGMPRSGQKDPEDPGVCFYFELKGKPHAMPCDRWNRAADNIAAIAKHIEAIRGMERWGVADVAQMFAGFAELPQTTEEWWQILGVDGNASHQEIESAYRELSKKAHPDVGGSDGAQARLNKAIGYYRDNIRNERNSS